MTETAHILAIDDDDRIRDLLKRFLVSEGYGVTTASDAINARKIMKSMAFDLIILDVMMPGEDGFSLLSSIRETIDTPVILLTAKDVAIDRIEGLRRGADDYVTKPFEPEELLLRVAAILRRSAPPEPVEEVNLSGQIFHVTKGELRRDGRIMRLTENEVQLLRILAQRYGEPVSRQELANLTSAGVERSVDVQVTRLRRKIEQDPREPIHLQTVRGIGYRLIGD
ncbi:response regulator [Hirschia baltica]|uniref:Two component transcriptional regulator, winged helix family n=1 Tax=Hirschia baltica (strain ATCC 49814 / DSM 5838 / IFAM 1418) TaxID=582402 RepID=C6XM73_HIRBI|nr:response regulator transcription factor [Hirschia baltica]ACT58016.1 two component transcriptional regulator, winged helix family [Hirschia baltica ATCC 49814]